MVFIVSIRTGIMPSVKWEPGGQHERLRIYPTHVFVWCDQGEQPRVYKQHPKDCVQFLKQFFKHSSTWKRTQTHTNTHIQCQ